MKDRIGNKLETGQRVLVMLPEAQIFGVIAETKETGRIAGVKGHGGIQTIPGRILVSCVIALPVDPDLDAVAQAVRVVDPEARDVAGLQAEPPKPN